VGLSPPPPLDAPSAFFRQPRHRETIRFPSFPFPSPVPPSLSSRQEEEGEEPPAPFLLHFSLRARSSSFFPKGGGKRGGKERLFSFPSPFSRTLRPSFPLSGADQGRVEVERNGGRRASFSSFSPLPSLFFFSSSCFFLGPA